MIWSNRISTSVNDIATAERKSVFLVKELPIPGTLEPLQGYYRSKLFTAPFTTNPLVAAAGPLLSLLERLCLSPTLPPINDLRENIAHELRAFHSRLQGRSYTEELSAIAHYLLTATIDEMVGKSYLRVFGQLSEFQAFTPSSYDDVGPEVRFFEVVHYIKEHPNQYLDLIELAYYCLIAGFEGEQHQRTDGRLVLDNLIEELFQVVQENRVNKSYDLFRDTKVNTVISKGYRPLILVAAVSIALLISGFILSHALLENKAKALQFSHPGIAKVDE